MDPNKIGCFKNCPRGAVKNFKNQTCDDCRNNGQRWLNEKCFSAPCPYFYYEDPVFKDCLRCYENCVECTGEKSTECSICKSGFYFETSLGPPVTKQCVAICSLGYFPDNELGICQNCPTDCIKCNKDGDCEECVAQTYLDSQTKTCGNLCIDGFYADMV